MAFPGEESDKGFLLERATVISSTGSSVLCSSGINRIAVSLVDVNSL